MPENEQVTPKRVSKKVKTEKETEKKQDENLDVNAQDKVKNDEIPNSVSKKKGKASKINTDNTDITKPYINNSRPVIELVSALSYILFFLPLIFCRREPFALYHANQSLILWLFMAIFYLAFGFIPGVNIYALPIIILFHILGIFYGMYNSAHGRARPFWLIGKINIIKWN